MKEKIDVLYLVDNSIESLGGEQESVKILLNGISKDYKVGIVQPGMVFKKNPKIKYFELTKKERLKHVIKNPFLFLYYINKVRKIIKNHKPKIIHTQSQASFFIVSFLMKIKLINKKHILVHTDRGLNSKYNTFIKRRFYNGFKKTNTLITTTKFNKEQWSNDLIKRNINVEYEVIENTAGKMFEFYDKEKKRNYDKFTVSFAGRYAKWKNWPLAFKITSKLHKKFNGKISVQMSIAVNSEKQRLEVKEIFQKFYDKMNNSFSGFINLNLEQMDDFYYNSDIFILTSNRNTESFGRTLVEAMSRKNVVLTTNAGGSVEVVNDDNKVFQSSDEFVSKVESYFNDIPNLRMEQQEVLNDVRRRYSLKNNLDKHLELYNRLKSIKGEI